MCNRPSRSLNSTVTALIRFSSVRYLSRCSLILSGATRFLRCSFASRFNSSSSSYDNARKFRSSLDNVSPFFVDSRCRRPDLRDQSDYPPRRAQRQSKVVMEKIKHSYGERLVWVGHSCPTPLILALRGSALTRRLTK